MKADDFKDTPRGWAERWAMELAAADKMCKDFMRRGDQVVKRYKDERDSTGEYDTSGESTRRLNLFHSNITMIQSMMYGTLPKVEVNRTFQDPNDDVGRVAALIMKRLLNNDIQENGKEYNSVLRQCLQDRLLPGLGCAKVRYVADFEAEEYTDPDTGETGTYDKLMYEDCLVEYHHWRDVRWGWSRDWEGIPWIGFRTYMSKKEATERFGAAKAKTLEYKQQSVEGSKDLSEQDKKELEEKAEVWEIWHKESRCVYWWGEGAQAILDKKYDPLKLSGFWPCPPFLAANMTTSLYMPVSDFYLTQDLYNEIDRLQTRITMITKAVKVVGVYDASSEGVTRMFQEGFDNDLIPVDSWAMHAEKGGLAGVVDWLPLQEVVAALDKLEKVRDSTIGLLFQVIGLSDIMRGQGNPTGGRVSAGEQKLKAEFGSIRIQARQDEFGQFASDLLQLKAEVVSKHFEPETILYMSQATAMPRADMRYLGDALRLIKDWDDATLRVKIRPESVAMVNYGELKQERTEFISALSMFMQSSAPMMEQMPESLPTLLELLKWGLAGFKGGNEVEGVIDQAIEKMQQQGPPQRQGEENKAAEVQAKMQADMAKIKATLQADLQKIQAKLQADLAVIQAKSSTEGQKQVTQAITSRIEELAQLEARIGEIEAETTAKIVEIQEGAKVRSSEKSGG